MKLLKWSHETQAETHMKATNKYNKKGGNVDKNKQNKDEKVDGACDGGEIFPSSQIKGKLTYMKSRFEKKSHKRYLLDIHEIIQANISYKD